MGITIEQLEQRVAWLEREVEMLKTARAADDNTPGWKKIVGTCGDDEMAQEAARLGAEYRAMDRGMEHPCTIYRIEEIWCP